MVDKVVALFVEGPTEVEFYKAVIKRARKLMGTQYNCLIEYIDMKGIGNYKNSALRKFKHLQRKYVGTNIFVFLCIDSDVFELSRKPPFDKNEVVSSLKDAGAKNVTYIIAKQSIEEWFLYDLEGVLNYLHLPKSTKRPKGNGQDALKSLFKLANKVYVKGGRTEGFIEKIDINKIMKKYCDCLNPLCKTIELNCDKVCVE